VTLKGVQRVNVAAIAEVEHQPTSPSGVGLDGPCSTPQNTGLFRQVIWQILGNATKRNILQQAATGSIVEVNLRAKEAIKPLEASGLTC
jgi:hypothetical protein